MKISIFSFLILNCFLLISAVSEGVTQDEERPPIFAYSEGSVYSHLLDTREFPLTMAEEVDEDVEATTVLNDDASDQTTTQPFSTFIYSDDLDDDRTKSEDLSQVIKKPYCHCVNRYYCQGTSVRQGKAVNSPRCPRADDVMCCITKGPGCGVPARFPFFNPVPVFGEANFGDYPWTALIMDASRQYIFSLGIIIAPKSILAPARSVLPYLDQTRLRVRVGEWDISSHMEPFKHVDMAVQEVIVHPRFNTQTFQNDIAILRLNASLDLVGTPNIRSACIVRSNKETQYFKAASCLAAGWSTSNKRVVNNPTHNFLKEVDMAVMDGDRCEQTLRKFVGDNQFHLDRKSFVCAGGEKDKGLCKGDEGAALVCQDKPGSRYMAIGMSSWGTQCGEQGFPGVFTNLGNYYDWIKSIEPNVA